MKPYKAFPITKAKTAWGLLQDVKKRVLQVPEGIDMRQVLERASTPCGSVACLAGECALLTLGFHNAVRFRVPHNDSRMSWAIRLLGGDNGVRPAFVTSKEQAVFERALQSFFDAGSSDNIGALLPGTPRYAQAVVVRMNKFMARFETRLKRTKLAWAFNAAC